MPKLLLPVVMAFVLLPAAGAAQDDAATYPVTSFFYWTDNTFRDLQGPAGRYNFEAGILGFFGRMAERYPGHYDPARLLEPEHLTGEAQVALDSVLHNRPRAPYSNPGDAGHPDFMPDWNGDGTFGDPGDFDADTDGDPHGGTPEALDIAFFRHPCANPDGTVFYETTGGDCVPAAPDVPWRLGVARELKIVSSRGLALDATLWLPHAAFSGSGCTTAEECFSAAAGGPFPGVVFSNGLASRQEHYYWFAMRMAREGYVVLTYDPAGQGESEGTWTDLFEVGPARNECQFPGACRDVQDATRWFAGDDVEAVADALLRVQPVRDPAENEPNPLLSILDRTKIALAGNSMGAISTLAYLDDLGAGAGIDGRPLPEVAAAVSLSGATPTRAVVPIQFQTSDYDGSPTLVGPGVAGVSLGFDGQGIGYGLIKQRYDCLRGVPLQNPQESCSGDDPAPLSLVVLEGGTHTDHAGVPVVPRTLWSLSLASDYAADWLNCHVLGDAGACDAAAAPRPHLSRAFASEQDPDGPAGPEESLCIRVPDRASLNQEPADFVATYVLGEPVYDCKQP